MFRILKLVFLLGLIGSAFSCGSAGNVGTGSAASTPTEAYKSLYAAVKAKDTAGIKAMLTKKSIDFGQMAAQRNNTPGDKIYENGFTGTTFSDTLPEIRDERIADNMGSVEVWNAKEKLWEDLPFINEDGGWKLAVGDLFAGTFKSPGKGRDAKEKEAANVISNASVPAVNAINTNSIPVTKPTIIPEGNKPPVK